MWSAALNRHLPGARLTGRGDLWWVSCGELRPANLTGKSDLLEEALEVGFPSGTPPFQEVFLITTFGENFRLYSRAVSRGDCHDTRRT